MKLLRNRSKFMADNYDIVADYIVSKYIDRISGADLEDTFVDSSPAKRVMVGMLSEDRIEESFSGDYVENSSTKFESVPSMSLNLKVYCFIR